MTEHAWTRLDPAAEALVEHARARRLRALAGRERLVSWASALTFLAVATALALIPSSGRSPSVLLVIAFVAAYALASRIEFEIGSGSAVPTQLVLIPMLFVLPVGTVPLWVALGFVLGQIPDYLRGRFHPERLSAVVGSAWHAVGPAAVFLAFGEPDPTISAWPILVCAVVAQFLVELITTTGRQWLAVGVPPQAVVGAFAWVFAVDALLTPVGFLAAIASSQWTLSFVLALPLVALLAVFAQDRKTRIGQALELSHAYRGTALLLGDVIEADDAYTGTHSRDVVELALAVADDLRVSARERRLVEFAALLHDVGKIRVPASIINKPGPLTADERAVINRHTLDGQQMLERVGGILGEVGMIVRSCHEQHDGSGYPDGLAGAAIPLPARIVSCCDAFNAMTTDRPYRRALPLADALKELQQHAGTQFDPLVSASLQRVINGS